MLVPMRSLWQALGVGCLFLLGSTAGCAASRLELDPAFAARAQPLHMEVPGGFWPPSHFILGPYEVSGVAVEKDGTFTVKLPTVELEGRGSFHLSGRMTGPAGRVTSIDCVGPQRKDWGPHRQVHIVFDPTSFGCKLDGAGANGGAMSVVRTRDMGEALLLFRDPTGRDLQIVQARQAVSIGNAGGLYVLENGRIVGAFDTTYPGDPRAWLAREMPLDEAFSVTSAMVTAYLLIGTP